MRMLRKSVAVLAIASAISVSSFFAIAHNSYVTTAKGDMEAFIQENVVDEPVSGLSDSIDHLIEVEAPVVIPIQKPTQSSALSDGKFEKLSIAWKRGVQQVVRDKRCKHVSKAFMVGETLNPLLRQANVIVESNCNAKVVGGAGEIGLFQPLPTTCKALGVTGDLTDPLVNAKCAEAHRQSACKQVKGDCTHAFLFLAHNRGVRGALKVKNPEATTYLRRIDYARRVLQGK